jgi:hypothetical protein
MQYHMTACCCLAAAVHLHWCYVLATAVAAAGTALLLLLLGWQPSQPACLVRSLTEAQCWQQHLQHPLQPLQQQQRVSVLLLL